LIDQRADLSIVVACQLLLDGRADALVSAGNTGGVILACSRAFERIEGVRRVALAAVLPTEKRRGRKKDPFALLLDVGATLHVESNDLYNFGLMGSIYASIVSSNEEPSIALLSNGTEQGKGPTEVVDAFSLLSNNDALNFIGNVEGLDIPRGAADVIVCEGFMGNVVLKLLEGITELAADLAKDAYESKLIWKLGLTMLSKELRKLRRLTDWKQYGGAPILGFDKVVIKAHGRSNARAIRNAIKLAAKVHEGDLVSLIQERMEQS
jgi:glycerol-3-phosphate acyltransferase PlsX